MKTIKLCGLFAASTLLSGMLFAQAPEQQKGQEDQSAESSQDSANRMPQEIIVTPYSNMNRRSIRSLISKTEEEFINRFNELNLDDDFDIDCYKYSASSTFIKQEICEPNFFREARRTDGSLAAFNMAQATTIFQLEAVQVQSDRSLRSGLSKEYVVLQRKVAALANSDDALKSLVTKLIELNYSLDNYNKD